MADRYKKHWQPGEEVSWPSGPGRMRTFHTGRSPVCGVSRGALIGYPDLSDVNCWRCRALAGKARTEANKRPVAPCNLHEDCRSNAELGLACKASRIA